MIKVGLIGEGPVASDFIDILKEHPFSVCHLVGPNCLEQDSILDKYLALPGNLQAVFELPQHRYRIVYQQADGSENCCDVDFLVVAKDFSAQGVFFSRHCLGELDTKYCQNILYAHDIEKILENQHPSPGITQFVMVGENALAAKTLMHLWKIGATISLIGSGTAPFSLVDDPLIWLALEQTQRANEEMSESKRRLKFFTNSQLYSIDWPQRSTKMMVTIENYEQDQLKSIPADKILICHPLHRMTSPLESLNFISGTLLQTKEQLYHLQDELQIPLLMEHLLKQISGPKR